MTPAEISLVLGLITLIAQYVPGWLASLTGHPDDTAAIAHARKTLEAIPADPARRALTFPLTTPVQVVVTAPAPVQVIGVFPPVTGTADPPPNPFDPPPSRL